MKRLLFVFIVVLALILTGCSGVSEDDHNAVVAERDQLAAQVEDLQAEKDALEAELAALQEESQPKEAVLRGGFTATVRDVIPDYVLDTWTPQVAVLTEFQDSPFVVHVGEEIGAQLEKGKTYVFTIRDMEVEVEEDVHKYVTPKTAYFRHNGFKVVSFRLAEEGETGLSSLQLEYVFEGEEPEKSELRSMTEAWLDGEFHRVYDQYYDLQNLVISNWHENGNEATFFYKMTWLNYNRDPDTVEYVRTAKENGSPHYEKLYQEYLGLHEANYEFKIVYEGDELKLYSNVSPKGTQWEPTKVDDYVMR